MNKSPQRGTTRGLVT